MKKFYFPEVMALCGFILAFIVWIASCTNEQQTPDYDHQKRIQVKVDSVVKQLK